MSHWDPLNVRPGQYGTHLNMGPSGQREYIPRAHPFCAEAGCQFSKVEEISAKAAEIVTAMGVSAMSAALWCDQGGHAFSERDPGRKRASIATLDGDTGREVMESRDYCGACAIAAGITMPRKTRPAIDGG